MPLIDGDLIKDKRIQLRFNGVHNFDEGDNGVLTLKVSTPFSDLHVAWEADEALNWRAS